MSDENNATGVDDAGMHVTVVKRSAPRGITRIASRVAVMLVVGVGVLAIVTGLGMSILSQVMGDTMAQAQEADSTVVVVSAAGDDGSTSLEQVSTGGAATPAVSVSNAAIYTFRDIFEPLIEKAAEPSTPTDSNDSTTTPTSKDTLYLQNIITEGGVRKAVLLLDGKTYTLGAGGAISGTPWLVLSVNQTSVTMLYGDIQVVLAIGQGITK